MPQYLARFLPVLWRSWFERAGLGLVANTGLDLNLDKW